MEKEFVPYDLALRLEALGFDEEYILACYDKDGNPFDAWARGFEKILDQSTSVLAPTFSQTFRWFREKYGMYSHIKTSGKISVLEFTWVSNGKYGFFSKDSFKTYEEAELACLDKLIEIVEGITESN